jgi:hypothetical protein
LQALARSCDWSALVQDAAWLPHAYDARQDTLVFAHLPRAAQRRAVFLDRRFVDAAAQSPPAPIAELPPAAIRDAAGPMHFIFHTAFCCSTLLARALDIPGVSMGVKEPAVLVSFAQHWSNARQTPGALSAFGVTLDLLSRPLAPGETQIIKPSNVSTHLVPEMLHLRPDAKALVLHSSLETFLHAIARRGASGRAFARQVFQGFAAAIPLDPVFSPDELLIQTDLQLAAQVWLMQIAFLESVVRRHGPERIRVLSSEAFLADPARTLASLARHFGLALDESQCARIAAGPVFRQHAKDHATPFDVAAHRAQNSHLGGTLGEEIATTHRWAEILARQCGAPLSLNDTLLD